MQICFDATHRAGAGALARLRHLNAFTLVAHDPALHV
jgi:hypothetical protein